MRGCGAASIQPASRHGHGGDHRDQCADGQPGKVWQDHRPDIARKKQGLQDGEGYNPANPVINSRSFGEDKKETDRLLSHFVIRKTQGGEGILNHDRMKPSPVRVSNPDGVDELIK